MSFLKLNSKIFSLGPTVLLAGLACATLDVKAAEGPFADYAGFWSGDGTISVASGANERIRCKATYAVAAGGSGLNQTLRCASDSYKLDISSNVVASGNSLSGSWSESTRGATGDISGRISGSQVNAMVAGVGFTAAFSVAMHGKTQSVTIHPQSGTDIRAVTISMHKN